MAGALMAKTDVDCGTCHQSWTISRACGFFCVRKASKVSRASKRQIQVWIVGTVRFFLALAVVIFHLPLIDLAHFWPLSVLAPHHVKLWMLPGTTAVEAFFLISGFFIALVLSTRYARLPLSAFYLSRALRIYPAYFVALLGALALIPVIRLAASSDVFGFAFMGADSMSAGNWLMWAVTNVTIVGKEYWFFNGGSWADLFSGSEKAVLRPLLRFQVISPAWSLALELQFYLLAPFIVAARTRTIVLLFVASAVLRTAVLLCGYPYEPYVYYVLPTQLCVFLAGVLSYRLFGVVKDAGRRGWLWAAGLCTLVVFYPYFSAEMEVDWMKFVLFALLVVALPSLASAGGRIDQILGDLSYPVYLVHLPIIGALSALNPVNQAVQAVTVVSLTIATSLLILYLVDWPIERVRRSWTIKQARGAV